MSLSDPVINLIGATQTPAGIEFIASNDADNAVYLLDQRGFVTASGPDAVKFMQGQLTCDVTEITPSLSSPGAHCNAKGRAVASFQLIQTGEDQYCFGLPKNNADKLKTNLGKYAVFSKVTIEEAELLALGLSGNKAKAFIDEQIGVIENELHSTVTGDKGSAIKVGDSRYELWLSEAQLTALWPIIAEQFTPAPKTAWALADIEAGIADIEAATSEELIPQMFGLEERGGISFTKGCYTGQEIVARLKYLGKQKRSLVPFSHQSDTVPSVGSVITSDAGKSFGTVVSATANKGLAVLNDGAEESALFIGDIAICINAK